MPVSRSRPALRYRTSEALLGAHLERLQQRHGMALWMITRIRDNAMWLLQVNDQHYGLKQGHCIEWERSYCIRMVERGAPCIVADTRENPVYQSAPINSNLQIGAYVGLPLLDSRDQLFGTLCALDPEAQPATLQDRLGELEHDAALISYTLEHALLDAQQQRLTTFIEHPDRCDDTGLPGAKGWQDIFQQEQDNCRNLGVTSAVMHLQAPHDADSLVIADSLAALLRDQDSVAHLGDNHFGILLTDTDDEKAASVAHRIRDALNAKRMLVRLQQEPLTPF
ncbi:diguanylate cyclase [Alcanivorax sp. S6407]|uniref:diguanylate cyclase domain-containing protein n=1 Tax=Alcanivorax sp. S6407 TaxID=2926424 RepID=UPI001FF592A1|nr:diguanylate cyclase [Alcanivorax sp. S6407]MCK0153016.1 diguanylate cyclase [Alcanivorax sp. S6407]